MAKSEISLTNADIGPVRGLIEVLVFFTAIVAGGILVSRYLPVEYSAYGAAVPFLSSLFAIAAGTILLMIQGKSWADIGLFGCGRFGREALIALALAAFVVVVVYYGGLRALGAYGVAPLDVSVLANIIQGDPAAYIAFMILVVWGSAAIGEEMIARGFIMNRFEAVFSWAPAPIVWAAIFQAALFGAGHAYQGPAGIFLSGVTGLIFAIVYYRFGRNLLIPILAHGFIDTIAITLIYLDAERLILPG